METLSYYWHKLKSAGRFYREAVCRFDLHSSFLTDWALATVEDRRWYYTFEDMARLEDYWKQRRRAAVSKTEARWVARASRHALTPAQGHLLFRIVSHRQPTTLLVLGTKLGLSALYLHRAALFARFIGLEEEPELYPLAQHSWQLGGQGQGPIRLGVFAQTLPQALAELGQVDLLYIDERYTGASCILLLRQVMPYLKPDSIFILEGIHGSVEKERTWEQIRQLPEVRQSVDLFHFGVLFFRVEWLQPQHWALLPYRFKPWRIGLGLK